MSDLYRGPRDRIFAEIFVSRLPSTVRGILSRMQTNSPNTDLKTLTQWADAIMEQTESTRTIQQITAMDKTERMEEAINQLSNRVDKLQTRNPQSDGWVPTNFQQERCRPTNLVFVHFCSGVEWLVGQS